MHAVVPSSTLSLLQRPFVIALLALLFLLLVSGGVSSAAPPPPHPLVGYEDCLLCHNASQQPAKLPEGHAAYAKETCAGCHSEAPAATSAPAAALLNGANTNLDQACLSCHQNQSLTMPLELGGVLSLHVDGDRYRQSVHGGRLACSDCHPSTGAYPHPKVSYASRRELSIAYYEACKRCHFANYTKTLDSVHFVALGAGNRESPVCTDCHGAHYVVTPGSPRSRDSEACGTCHVNVYRDYADSVHGRALVDEDNPDVPGCTDCHGVHSIQGASSSSFRLASTQLCARCHQDTQLMTKYGLSANVLKTYFEDFHGRTIGFYQLQSSATQPAEPLCLDCHGIHNIKSTRDPASPVIQANLQATCQKCHSDASSNFPTAWLAHYEPSPEKAPLVYYIRLYYWILIPVMIGGLGMHIGLDLWRIARNR